MAQTDDEFARLKWRCRRGMLELDLLLQPFVETYYQGLAQEDKHQFHVLLDLSDQDLLEYLLCQKAPEDPRLSHLISTIRAAA